MVDIDNVKPFRTEQTIEQDTDEETEIIYNSSEGRLAVAWPQRQAVDPHPLDRLTLNRAQAVTGIKIAMGVIWKAGDHLNIMPRILKGAGKSRTLENRLGLKPLSHIQNAHGRAASMLR